MRLGLGRTIQKISVGSNHILILLATGNSIQRLFKEFVHIMYNNITH